MVGIKHIVKRISVETLERPKIMSKTSSDSSEGCSSVNKKSSKKKISKDKTQEPRKRSRNTPRPEGPSQQTSMPVQTAPPNSRAAFEEKYKQEEKLGIGGFGTVYDGYCKFDNTPVAIKHVCQHKVEHFKMWLNDEYINVPLEVGLMLKLKPAEGTTSAAVTLLDWYNMDDELILVLEKPDRCLNLEDYINQHRTGILTEMHAKEFARKLLDAVIEIHSKKVFHRDIKPHNILIDFGSDVPRVRLIDFGCGTLITKDSYGEFKGTCSYMPPEIHQHKPYMAEPTTVWQLGVVLFQAMHVRLPFETSEEIISKDVDISPHISNRGQNFLRKCLHKEMLARPTLDALKNDPWLR